jgi:hypothetical protein
MAPVKDHYFYFYKPLFLRLVLTSSGGHPCLTSGKNNSTANAFGALVVLFQSFATQLWMAHNIPSTTRRDFGNSVFSYARASKERFYKLNA